MTLTKEQINLQKTFHVTDLIRMPYGVANEVYLSRRENHKFVLKLYQKDPNFTLIEKMLKIYQEHHIKTLEIIEKHSIENKTLCIYPFIEGCHVLKLNTSQIDKILDIIKLNYLHQVPKFSFQESIFSKYKIYENYFRKESPKRVNTTLVKQILEITDQIHLEQVPCSIVHGDLSPYNIIWQKNNPILIDLDECIIAPIYYEFIVFLIKYCFQDGLFDLEMAVSIMNQYYKIFSENDKSALIDTWYFYITKVLLEKLYYYDLGYIELDDPIQIKDNYLWWIELLNNKQYISKLFCEK